MNTIEVYTVIHSSPEIRTVGDYCVQVDSPAHEYVGKETDFLNVKDPVSGLTNRDSIFSSYCTPTEESENRKKRDSEIYIKTGTQLFVPVNKINTAGLLTQGIEVVSNDEYSFKSKALADLEGDQGYVQIIKPIQGQLLSGITKVTYPMFTVWMWCRSLSQTYNSDGKASPMNGELFDITPFLIKISTSVGKDGGNFQLTLPPLTCELESMTDESGRVNNRWVIKKGAIKVYSSKTNISDSLAYVADDNMFSGTKSTDQGEYLKRNQFLFHTMINENDLVFIRYESLGLEASQRYEDKSNFYVNKDNIANRIYDMIGLVDTNIQEVDPNTNDVSINITGRDLIKLFIDDGTYFYNLENITGQFRIAGESARENELMRRIVGDNSLYYLNLYQNTSIEHVLQFVIQQLSSIGVVPDELLTSYGSRRNYRFTQTGNDQDNLKRNSRLEDKKNLILNQITQIKKQSDISYKHASSTPIFVNFKNFLKKIRDSKTRKTNSKQTIGWGNTVLGNELISTNILPQFIVQQFGDTILTNIFNRSNIALQSVINVIDQVDELLDIETTQPNQDENRFNKELSRGVWQIVKLVIDQGVTDRRIVDSSMSSANGSLLNFIRKVCQEPFVEFRTDTYGDMFYLVVRKPPFDKKSVQGALQGQVNTESGPVTIKPVIIDIESEDVIKEDLSYGGGGNAFSWYNFRPQNVFAAGGSVLPAAYTPAVFFEEYAKIWGSRPLDVVHNYNPYYPIRNNDGVVDVSRFEKQAILDLKYLIESHAYLPFTRHGTLVLNGDRRIKSGNFIRYRSTNEIFYVDSVAQHGTISDRSIDRTTVVQVSRGMVEQFIYGVEFPGEGEISYFNIINTDIKVDTKKYPPKKQKITRRVTVVKDPTASKLEYIDKEIEEEIDVPGYMGIDIEKALSNLKVNQSVFNYFLRKEQFDFREYIRTGEQLKQQGSRR